LPPIIQKEGIMPTHFVEDYEEITGKKLPKSAVETKVVIGPPIEDDTPLYNATEAETK